MKSKKYDTGRRSFIVKTSVLSAGFFLMNGYFASARSHIKLQQKNFTVQEIIDMILADIPVDPISNTVDTIKFGNPKQIVTGIVTTMFATDEVIEATGKLGANFIIAHEPTFYNHADETKWLTNDPVYLHKIELLKKYNITVWRFHDYIHSHKPDGVLMGVLNAMSWNKYYNDQKPWLIDIPAVKLGAIISQLKQKLSIDHLKYIGDVAQTCKKIAILPGAYGGMKQIGVLQSDNPDLIIVGELNEWETSEYVRDIRSAGSKTSLIVLGHIVSEEPGLEWLKQWFKLKVPDLKVTHIPSKDAFKWA